MLPSIVAARGGSWSLYFDPETVSLLHDAARRFLSVVTNTSESSVPVLFWTWMAFASAIEIHLVPPYPVVSQSVTLNVTDVTGTIRAFSWYNGTVLRSSYQILSYNTRNNPPEAPGSLYFHRATGLANASLLISDLVITDMGTYTVEIQTQHPAQTASVSLPIFDYVTKPVVRAPTCPPLKNEALSLTCDTTNAETIKWGRTRGSLPPTATLSPDHRTVTFSKIKPSDDGEYWCEVQNPLSRSISDTYMLTTTCPCQSEASSCASITAGIICGALLGAVVTTAAAFLLYKRCVIPVRDAKKEPSIEIQFPSTMYMQDVITNPSTTEEPYYMLCAQNSFPVPPAYPKQLLMAIFVPKHHPSTIYVPIHHPSATSVPKSQRQALLASVKGIPVLKDPR
ncbi:cell adhesion molecule CEACAM8-like [Pelodytes ibericus]